MKVDVIVPFDRLQKTILDNQRNNYKIRITSLGNIKVKISVTTNYRPYFTNDFCILVLNK